MRGTKEGVKRRIVLKMAAGGEAAADRTRFDR
jgi:hypothetical protein